MPNALPLFVYSFCFLVKLSPLPIKTGFEDRERLEAHSYKRGKGKKCFIFQGYSRFNKALSPWRKGCFSGGRDAQLGRDFPLPWCPLWSRVPSGKADPWRRHAVPAVPAGRKAHASDFLAGDPYWQGWQLLLVDWEATSFAISLWGGLPWAGPLDDPRSRTVLWGSYQMLLNCCPASKWGTLNIQFYAQVAVMTHSREDTGIQPGEYH